MKKRLLKVILVIIIIISSIVAIYLYNFILSDKCFDKGGVWDEVNKECITQDDVNLCIQKGGTWDYKLNICNLEP